MTASWQPDFERLFDEHQSMVFSLALRMTGDRGLAEEIAQDVFMELDRHITKIESAQHAIFWLRRVTISRSTDALRRRRVRGMDQWVEIDESHGAREVERRSPLGDRIEALLTETRPSQGRDPATATQERQMAAALCDGIDALSDTLRTTLILVSIDGLSHEDAGEGKEHAFSLIF